MNNPEFSNWKFGIVFSKPCPKEPAKKKWISYHSVNNQVFSLKKLKRLPRLPTQRTKQIMLLYLLLLSNKNHTHMKQIN